MKLISIFFLTLSLILSIIACILPHWSKNEIIMDMKFSDTVLAKADMSRHDGLWLKCEKTTGSFLGAPAADMKHIGKSGIPGLFNGCKSFGAPGIPEPEGNLASKILAIVGSSLLLISTLLATIGSNHSKIVGILAVWCMLALVLVYPLLVLNHNIKDEHNICHQPTNPILKDNMDVTCHTGTLSISYFLEIGAIVLAIIGLLLNTHKSSKRKR